MIDPRSRGQASAETLDFLHLGRENRALDTGRDVSVSGKSTILIVDDDQNLLRTIGDFLEVNGFTVVRTNGSAPAMQALQNTRPDLILLDVMMPDKDGGTVAQEIRNDPVRARIPIIFLTAIISKEEARDHAGIIGGESFIAKPVDPDELLREINLRLSS